jgi:hypothetical protein
LYALAKVVGAVQENASLGIYGVLLQTPGTIFDLHHFFFALPAAHCKIHP